MFGFFTLENYRGYNRNSKIDTNTNPNHLGTHTTIHINQCFQ